MIYFPHTEVLCKNRWYCWPAVEGATEKHMPSTKVYGHKFKCYSPNGHFPNILFTATDETQKTFPENQLSKGHFPNQFFTIFFSFFIIVFHFSDLFYFSMIFSLFLSWFSPVFFIILFWFPHGLRNVALSSFLFLANPFEKYYSGNVLLVIGFWDMSFKIRLFL